jgi:hypothetical protein
MFLHLFEENSQGFAGNELKGNWIIVKQTGRSSNNQICEERTILDRDDLGEASKTVQ